MVFHGKQSKTQTIHCADCKKLFARTFMSRAGGPKSRIVCPNCKRNLVANRKLAKVAA